MNITTQSPRVVMDELIEELAGGVGALTMWASLEHGARVALRADDGVNPSDLTDRLSLLVYAVRQLRCRRCAGLATGTGRICLTCEAAERTAHVSA